MLLSRSFRRKILATLMGSLAFLLVYEATVMDSRGIGGSGLSGAGARLEFTATAYCKGHTTASGVTAQAGIAAADPTLLPEGSVVQVDGVPDRHAGIYTVLDTGPAVRGRQVDLYMWSCHDALAFGRRDISLTVLRLGWRPNPLIPDVLKGDGTPYR